MNAAARPEGLFVSVSQLKLWMRCPRAYEYRYVRGATPEFLPMALAFGTAVHAALGHHYGWVMKGSPAPVEESKQRFIDSMTVARTGPVPLQEDEDGDSWDALIAKGLGMVEVALAHPLASSKVLAVEKSFTVDLYDPATGEVLEEKLTGVIDLVIEEDGHPTIVEHKTSARKYSADQLLYDVQPSAYSYGAEFMGWPEFGLKFNVITKTKVPAVQVEELRRDENDIEDFLHTAVGVLKAIDNGISFPIRGWGCKGCPFKARCRASGAGQ